MTSTTTPCLHIDTHHESWPDGGGIEVCNVCGMSRHHTEFTTSPWIMIENITDERDDMQAEMDRIAKGTR